MDTMRPVMMSVVGFFYIAVLCYFSFAPCMLLNCWNLQVTFYDKGRFSDFSDGGPAVFCGLYVTV